MITNIYGVYDVKAAAYLNPFFLINDELAKRECANLVMNENHNFAKHPADYTLFKLGEWDDSTAQISPLSAPLAIATMLELKAQIYQMNEAINEVSDDPRVSGRPES